MKLLEDKILKAGQICEGNILRVDTFLNHQIDIDLLEKMAEDAKVSIRNVRHDGIDKAKKAEISEDEQKGIEKDIQDLVNEYNKKVESILKEKEQELLTV